MFAMKNDLPFAASPDGIAVISVQESPIFHTYINYSATEVGLISYAMAVIEIKTSISDHSVVKSLGGMISKDFVNLGSDEVRIILPVDLVFKFMKEMVETGNNFCIYDATDESE